MARQTHPRALGWDDLGSGDQALFLRDVDGAIARRDADWFAARRALWIEWVLTGLVGLVGLFVLGWSAPTSALLLLAAFWLVWIVDIVQWLSRADALATSLSREADDERIWQIAALLRGTRRRAPDARGNPTPLLSIVVDLVAGAAATALLLRGLGAAGVDRTVIAADSGSLLLGVALLVAAGIAPMLHARLRRRADGGVALPTFRFGQRGIGLLVLVFALMAAGGGTLAPRVLLACAYGFFLVMGAIELLFGLRSTREDTEWLRRKRCTESA